MIYYSIPRINFSDKFCSLQGEHYQGNFYNLLDSFNQKQLQTIDSILLYNIYIIYIFSYLFLVLDLTIVKWKIGTNYNYTLNIDKNISFCKSLGIGHIKKFQIKKIINLLVKTLFGV